MGREPVEAVAEYFAACVLMPKRLIKRAWGEGHQRVSELSDLFDVSPRAMKIRLEHTWPRGPSAAV
jgi:Zn-dependent peptidase ImmA (M78 family)